VLAAIEQAGLGPARATLRRAPAWTTDWISEDGRAKLREYGIAPPATCIRREAAPTAHPHQAGRMAGERIACPRCGSEQTERTVRLRLHRLQGAVPLPGCREPFEHFKPI
jgi:ring-1,2-phenylacetyl-CoA epoxidase subunit PaaD